MLHPMKSAGTMLLPVLLLLFSLFSACQREIEADNTPAPETTVNVVVSTRAAAGADDAVKSLRLIVTGYTETGMGTVSYNQLTQLPNISAGFQVKARKGDNNFYLIANETAAMTTALNALKTAQDVELFKVNFQLPQAGESPVMLGTMKRVTVVAEDKNATATVNYTDESGEHTGQDKLPMTLTRIVGRFSLTFIKNSDVFTVKDINFKVLRIPVYSYLGETQRYPGTTWSTETLPQSSTAALTANNTATWKASTKEYEYSTEGNRVSFADFYLPEHLPVDAHRGLVDYSTVLLVNGTCVLPGGREQDANWLVNLMANEKFSIQRNTWYKVAVSITGMGAMGMAAEVMPVTEHDIPVNWGATDGLIVVSDRTADYGKNRSVANDMTAYSGILKVVKTQSGTATFHDALFKYGSVIGISAPAASGAAYNSATDVLYNPALSGNSYLLTPWAAVPAAASSATVSGNTYAALKQGLGDPCQLIGVTSRQMEQGRYSNELWHTATPEELQRLIDNGDVPAGGAADSRGLPGFSELLVPTAVRRDANGSSVAAGGKGYYWSSSAAKRLVFIASPYAASMDTGGSPQEAHAVRCVRNTIPESKITAANTTIGYQGGTFTIPVNSNVPHWKVELLTSTGDPSGIVLNTTSGSYAGSISGTVPRRALSGDRNCHIRITGTGYDGRQAERTAQLLQTRLEWRATIVSNTIDNAGRIPSTGGSYTAKLSVTPVDIDAFPSDATYKLTIASGTSITEGTKTAMTGQTMEIPFTISENPSSDIRMVTLRFEVSGTGINCWTEQSKIQEKK